MKNRVAFSMYHPAFLFVFYLSVILITVFTQDPVVQILSLIGALLFNIKAYAEKLKNDLLYIIILFVLISITNPIFSQNGVTVLFYLGDIAYTLESLVYGVNTALMISSVILWFKCLNMCMTDDKMQYLFSKVLPKTTLVITMIMRFIPLYRKNIRDITDAQNAMGTYQNKGLIRKVKNAAQIFLSLVTQSLENSVETAYSMKARGYEEGKRTNFFTYRIRPTDFILTLSIIGYLIILVVFKIKDTQAFVFYPKIGSPTLTLERLLVYIGFGIISLVPFLTEIAENIKWKYYLSKI